MKAKETPVQQVTIIVYDGRISLVRANDGVNIAAVIIKPDGFDDFKNFIHNNRGLYEFPPSDFITFPWLAELLDTRHAFEVEVQGGRGDNVWESTFIVHAGNIREALNIASMKVDADDSNGPAIITSISETA